MKATDITRTVVLILISFTLAFGISLTRVESSEPLSPGVIPPTDLKKDMVAAAGEGSGPTTEKPVIGATQPPSPLSWNVRAGLLLLHRENNDKLALVTNSFAPGGTVLVNANDLNLGTEFGVDASLGVKLRMFGTAFGAELRYFGLTEWSESQGPLLSPGGGVVRFLTPIGNTGFPANISAEYKSKLQNAEFNLSWHPIEKRLITAGGFDIIDQLSVLIGGRYINLDEEMKITQDIGPGLNTAIYKVPAKNELWGGQIGIEAVPLRIGGLSIESFVKMICFNNDMHTKAQITQTVGPTFLARSTKEKTTWASEFGIGLKYAFNQYIAFSGRYQLLWLDKVALSPQQVPASDPALRRATVATDSVLYQGGWVGIVISF